MKIIQENNPYEKNTPYRYQAIIYLAYIKNEEKRFIADLFDYTISTIRTYCCKYYYLLEESKKIFEPRIIFEETITNPNNYNLTEKNKFFYLVKFYDSQGKFLVSKIGTTERSVQQRLREHFRKGTPYSKMGAEYVQVDKVYKCSQDPRGIESYVRGLLMLKYNLFGQDQFYENIEWQEIEEEIEAYFKKTLDK